MALTASDADLATYGFPPRPYPFGRSQAAYNAWARGMASAKFRVQPDIRPTGRRHGPAMIVSQARLREAGVATSKNWSGQEIVNTLGAYGASSFGEITAQWAVSAVQQAVGTCSGTDVSATWVGIDGANNGKDVFQGGTEADAFCSGGATTRNYYPWFEWYPANEYEITNFASYPGQPIYVVMHATSATAGSAIYVDLETGAYTSVALTAPAGTKLIGNSAEWIEERPSNSKNVIGTLADFGAMWMSSEIVFEESQIGTAAYELPGAPGGSGTAYTLTMLDNNGNTIATSAPQGLSAQVVTVSGSAK